MAEGDSGYTCCRPSASAVEMSFSFTCWMGSLKFITSLSLSPALHLPSFEAQNKKMMIFIFPSFSFLFSFFFAVMSLLVLPATRLLELGASGKLKCKKWPIDGKKTSRVCEIACSWMAAAARR